MRPAIFFTPPTIVRSDQTILGKQFVTIHIVNQDSNCLFLSKGCLLEAFCLHLSTGAQPRKREGSHPGNAAQMEITTTEDTHVRKEKKKKQRPYMLHSICC